MTLISFSVIDDVYCVPARLLLGPNLCTEERGVRVIVQVY
jgi:hypothetical protein